MKASDIRRFFSELDKRLETSICVILTGGAAGILQGVDRVTQDIDFELKLSPSKTSRSELEAFEKAVQEVGRVTGITPQYAEDIDRWSAIAMPEKKSWLYAHIGKVEVRILDAGLWAIGKLTRYLSSDITDLTIVLKSAKTDPNELAKLWGSALGSSPISNTQIMFRRQVEQFFSQHSNTIWGSETDPAQLIQIFLKSAQDARSS